MGDAATFFMPVLASLLTAVVLVFLGYLFLVPRLEERIANLKASFDTALHNLMTSIDKLEKQLEAHATGLKEAAEKCEGKREAAEVEAFKRIGSCEKELAVLNARTAHSRRSLGSEIIE